MRAVDAEDEVTEFSIVKRLEELLPGKPGNTAYVNIALPTGTTLSHEAISPAAIAGAGVRLKNSHVQIDLHIQRIGSNGLLYTELGEALRARLPDPDGWHTKNYLLQLRAEFSRWHKWSHRTSRLRRWVMDVADKLDRDFSWEKVRPDLAAGLAAMEAERPVPPI